MKIVSVLFKYDYGLKERGESTAKRFFIPALEKIFIEVKPFWLEKNGFQDNHAELEKKLSVFLESEKPEMIFFDIFKDEFREDFLKELKEKYITFNFFDDDQWRFDDFSKYKAPLFTHCSTPDKFSLQRYRKESINNVYLAQWGTFDYISDEEYRDTNYRYEVTFIGQKTETREWMIEELKNSGIRVECFGFGWENGRISFEEMKDIFKSSKINLNLSNSLSYDKRFMEFYSNKMVRDLNNDMLLKRVLKKIKRGIMGKSHPSNPEYLYMNNKKNVEQIKARNFEIPGFGGFQLSQFTAELSDYYNIGLDVSVFSNIDELKKMIFYYLQNDEERENIRRKGYERTRQYTYENILRKVFIEAGIIKE